MSHHSPHNRYAAGFHPIAAWRPPLMPGPSKAAMDLAWSYAKGAAWWSAWLFKPFQALWMFSGESFQHPPNIWIRPNIFCCCSISSPRPHALKSLKGPLLLWTMTLGMKSRALTLLHRSREFAQSSMTCIKLICPCLILEAKVLACYYLWYLFILSYYGIGLTCLWGNKTIFYGILISTLLSPSPLEQGKGCVTSLCQTWPTLGHWNFLWSSRECSSISIYQGLSRWSNLWTEGGNQANFLVSGTLQHFGQSCGRSGKLLEKLPFVPWWARSVFIGWCRAAQPSAMCASLFTWGRRDNLQTGWLFRCQPAFALGEGHCEQLNLGLWGMHRWNHTPTLLDILLRLALCWVPSWKSFGVSSLRWFCSFPQPLLAGLLGLNLVSFGILWNHSQLDPTGACT